jgi:hypothetical protein
MDFGQFKRYYLAIYVVEISGIFYISSQTNVLQDLTVACVQKRFFPPKNLVLVLEMAVLECFG